MRPFDYGGKPPSGADAERMLELPTRLLREASGRNQALAALDFERALSRLEHRWLPYKGLQIHLEVQPARTGAATFVIIPGLGDHARRQLALATALAEHGYGAIAVDRQGHGLSEGRRGDAPLRADFDVVELAIGYARVRSQGPVVALGDSLGGIMTWFLLTAEPDIEAAVCHCIGHPDVHVDPSYRYKEPLLRALGTVLPRLPVPVRQIADYDHVALDPVTKRYFDDQVDALFNFKVSARSVASYLGFRPPVPWQQVTIPTLVMIGAEDRMVTPEFTAAAFERDHPPAADYLSVPGAGHQLFLDDLGLALPQLLDWAARRLSVGARS
jgi:acylglycerol lipase